MKINKLNCLNFGKKSEYVNCHRSCAGEPMLSVVAQQVIAKTPRLSNGYYYEIRREGQNYRFAELEPANFHDQLTLSICNRKGDRVTVPSMIYYKRLREPDADFAYVDDENFGRLDRENLIDSLKQLLKEKRVELRNYLKNYRNASLAPELPTRALHLSLRIG